MQNRSDSLPLRSGQDRTRSRPVEVPPPVPSREAEVLRAASDVKDDPSSMKVQQIQASGRHANSDRKKDLGPIIMANNNNSDYPSNDPPIIVPRPMVTSSGGRGNERRQQWQPQMHINDSVISIEDERTNISSPAIELSAATTTTTNGGAASEPTSQQLTAATDNGQLQQQQHQQNGNGAWMMNMAAQTTQEMRQRVSMASDQLGLSLRHLYASATTAGIGVDVLPPSYHNIPGIVPYYRGRSSGPPPSYDDVINPYAPPPTYQSLFGQMREASKNSRGFMDLLKRLVILSTIGCSLLLAFVVLVPFSMIVVGAIYLNDCRIEHIPGFLLVGGLVWASKNVVHCCAQCQEDNNIVDDELPDYGYYEEQQQHQQHQTEVTSIGSGGVDTNTIGYYHQQAEANNNLDQSVPPPPPQQQQRSRTSRSMKSSVCESLLNCILFGWFVAGCVIVFRNHNPDFEDQTSPKFCNRTVYMFTFWLITSGLVVFSLFVSCICCLMISSAIATRQDDDLS